MERLIRPNSSMHTLGAGYFTPEFTYPDRFANIHPHTRRLNPADPEYYDGAVRDLEVAAGSLKRMKEMVEEGSLDPRLVISVNELSSDMFSNISAPDYYINDAPEEELEQDPAYQTENLGQIDHYAELETGPFTYSSDYIDLVGKVYNFGTDDFNQRTASRIRFLTGQVLRHQVSQGIPMPGLRKVFPYSAAAEFAWSLMGTNNISWLQKYTSMWDKFADENNEADGAYGRAWIADFGRDQIDLMVEALREDPSSRQVHVSTWNPAQDGLDPQSKRLTPCLTSFSANIQGGFLNMQVDRNYLNTQVEVRSSDLIVGLPYDAMFFSFFTSAVANELDKEPGVLTMWLNHAHIYHVHSEMLQRTMHPAIIAPTLSNLPKFKLSQIRQEPDDYVNTVINIPTIQPQNIEQVEVVDASPNDFAQGNYDNIIL